MAKKLWRSLLLLFLFVIIILAIQVSALKSQLEVRESAIENLVDETGVELIREFRQAVDQVKSIKYRKNYFETQNDYLQNHIPYSNPLRILKGFSIRFGEDYLQSQVVFEPFPKQLVKQLDSGKKI